MLNFSKLCDTNLGKHSHGPRVMTEKKTEQQGLKHCWVPLHGIPG